MLSSGLEETKVSGRSRGREINKPKDPRKLTFAKDHYSSATNFGAQRWEHMSSGVEDMTDQMRLDTRHSELLPGINDEITLNQITPKLSWRDFYILSLVSRGWRDAIQTRQVYDARVRLQSTEQLVIINQKDAVPIKNVIILFDVRDHSFHQLPLLPHFDAGRGCVTVDGRVYVLLCEGDVYVMDLAGQRKWTQCASRGKSKKKAWNIKCEVIHGKIYVYSESLGDTSIWLDVFDPANNSWSVIRPPQSKPLGSPYLQFIRTAGEELFLCCELCDPEDMNSTFILQVYDPAKDEWREVESPLTEAPFCRQGKLYAFDAPNDRFDGTNDRFVPDVVTFDAEENSWSHICSCSFRGLKPHISYQAVVESVVVVDDEELLAVVSWHAYLGWFGGVNLLKSVGFGKYHSEILWQVVDVSLPIWPPRSSGSSVSSMSSIEL